MDVTVETEWDGGLLAKLQTDECEVNIRAPRAELMKLRGIRAADWNEGRSVRVGESAGAPVFWAIDGENVTLMIGHDDETWDVAVRLPVGAVEELLRQAEV
jgi:hypothetical protein